MAKLHFLGINFLGHVDQQIMNPNCKQIDPNKRPAYGIKRDFILTDQLIIF